uniref:Uncharacterized protein n=1 Tax=Opuntia streptacantha TaxID=393608 RepID=A0A7C9F5E6_OPUST
MGPSRKAHRQVRKTSTLALLRDRHSGQAETTPSQSVQTQRCRHGSKTTEATRFRHTLQLSELTRLALTGSTYADSLSSASPPPAHDCPTPSGSCCNAPPAMTLALALACCIWACRTAAWASWAWALARHDWASALSWAHWASSSALRLAACSTSASFSLIVRATASSAAPSSAR